MLSNSTSNCLRAPLPVFRITTPAKFFIPRSSCPLSQPVQCQAQYFSSSAGFTPRMHSNASLSRQKYRAPSTCSSRVVNRRSNSSTSASPATSVGDTQTSSLESQPLTWDAYLSLRQKRRYYNVIASSLTAAGTFVGGASFLLNQDLEKLSGFMFGLDPFITMGAVSLGFAAIGWLMGPFAGGIVFRLLHRRVAKSMELKDKNFYDRIKKHRSDPTGQSATNPVPDYYGERIFSVKGYKQWLRDQRAFRKKREVM